MLYPVTLLRVAMKATEAALATISNEGTQESLLDLMQSRQELYDLLGYRDYEARTATIFSAGALATRNESHPEIFIMSEPIYSPGLEGVIAGETAISTITGGLQYRGYSIEAAGRRGHVRGGGLPAAARRAAQPLRNSPGSTSGCRRGSLAAAIDRVSRKIRPGPR